MAVSSFSGIYIFGRCFLSHNYKYILNWLLEQLKILSNVIVRIEVKVCLG